MTGVAIIGLGMAVAPHIRSLLDLRDRVDVRWAASRSEKRASAFRETFDVPGTTDVIAAIRDPAVDAVLLLTPPNTHLELARACFAAGKHVLVEKPLDVSPERARALVEEAEQAGSTLAVMLQHRFRPASLRLRALLEGGSLGRVEMASMTVPWWRPQAYYDEPGRGTRARDGGGVLMTQAIHTLDLFRSLVGDMAVLAAQTTTTGLHRMETEDYAAALLRLESGAPATIAAMTAFFPGDPERIEIGGTKGSASMTGGSLTVRFLDGQVEEVEAESGTGGGADPMDFPHDAHLRLITDFLDAIDEGRAPIVSGAQALATQELIEAILAAAGRS